MANECWLLRDGFMSCKEMLRGDNERKSPFFFPCTADKASLKNLFYFLTASNPTVQPFRTHCRRFGSELPKIKASLPLPMAQQWRHKANIWEAGFCLGSFEAFGALGLHNNSRENFLKRNMRCDILIWTTAIKPFPCGTDLPSTIQACSCQLESPLILAPIKWIKSFKVASTNQ